MASASPSGQPSHLHLQVEHLAGDHLAPEPGPLDTSEQWQPPGKASIGQHGHAT